jgi:hypothetical protein
VILKSVKPLTVVSTRDVVTNFVQKVQYANGLLDFLKGVSILAGESEVVGAVFITSHRHEVKER